MDLSTKLGKSHRDGNRIVGEEGARLPPRNPTLGSSNTHPPYPPPTNLTNKPSTSTASVASPYFGIVGVSPLFHFTFIELQTQIWTKAPKNVTERFQAR
ncbi:unnamed protein product [Linum trigynum]|uniref:Uncharacterized protein n=1 Tax=Linum trigynum TaxID=586398 RepID=A0AAV2G9Q0_9ROSI